MGRAFGTVHRRSPTTDQYWEPNGMGSKLVVVLFKHGNFRTACHGGFVDGLDTSPAHTHTYLKEIKAHQGRLLQAWEEHAMGAVY